MAEAIAPGGTPGVPKKSSNSLKCLARDFLDRDEPRNPTPITANEAKPSPTVPPTNPSKHMVTQLLHPSAPMKTIRHTVNIPSQLDELIKERSQDFRSLSAYLMALCFTDMLYLPRRRIAQAFANASWRQQNRAIENILALREHGWNGVDLQAVAQLEEAASKCLNEGDWLLDQIAEELAYTRGADLRPYLNSPARGNQLRNTRDVASIAVAKRR